VAAVLAIVTGNVVLFYVMRWPLDVTAWRWLASSSFGAWPSSAGYPHVLRGGALHPHLRLHDPGLHAGGAYLHQCHVAVRLDPGIGLLVDNAVVVIENYDRIASSHPELSLREAMLRAATRWSDPWWAAR